MASMSLVPERKVWAIFTTASSAQRPALQQQRVLARQPLGGVGLQVHRGVHQQLAALVVVRHLAGGLAQHVEEGGEDVERLAAVAVLTDLVQPAAADLVGVERLGAVLHQGVRPHVVVGADHQAAERVHERVVAVAAVAGPEQVLDQPLQPLVPQPPVQVGEELLLLPRADVVEVVVRLGLLQQRVVFLLVGRAGVVEDDHPHRVAVAPEVLVVVLDRLAHVPQPVGGDDEEQVFLWHKTLALIEATCLGKRNVPAEFTGPSRPINARAMPYARRHLSACVARTNASVAEFAIRFALQSTRSTLQNARLPGC